MNAYETSPAAVLLCGACCVCCAVLLLLLLCVLLTIGFVPVPGLLGLDDDDRHLYRCNIIINIIIINLVLLQLMVVVERRRLTVERQNTVCCGLLHCCSCTVSCYC